MWDAVFERRIQDLMDFVLRDGWGSESVSVSSQKARRCLDGTVVVVGTFTCAKKRVYTAAVPGPKWKSGLFLFCMHDACTHVQRGGHHEQ